MNWKGTLAAAKQDFAYALRSLRKSPTLICVAVLSLAVGIGAATTLFTTIDTLDFRALPFRDPSRLVWLTELSPAKFPRCPRCPLQTSQATAVDWLARSRSIQTGAAIARADFEWVNGDVVESPQALRVTPGFLSFLGASPLYGREFVTDDTLARAGDVALLSYDFWQQRFHGARDIVGRLLPFYDDEGAKPSTRNVVIVGVLPRTFRFFGNPSLLLPLRLDKNAPRTARSTVALGRLRPGISIQAATTELTVITNQIAGDNVKAFQDWSVVVRPLQAYLSQNTGRGRFLVFAITGLVLLIAILNVSSLLLARTVSRQSELALRTALGASRVRIASQVLAEGWVIGVMGGVTGAFASLWGVGFASRWFKIDSTGLPMTLDPTLVAFMIGITAIVATITGLVPALAVTRTNLAGSLRGATTTLDIDAKSRSGALVTFQIALALAVLSAASVLTSDYLRIRYLDIGYDPSGLYTTDLVAARGRASAPDAWRSVVTSSRAAIMHIHGVEDVSVEHISASHPKLIRPADRVITELPLRPYAEAVDADYFHTWQTPLTEGRQFQVADDAGNAKVAIVNRSLAAAFWPGVSAIGRQIFLGDSARSGEVATVVGVVADVERGQLVQRHWPMVYLPFAQAQLYGPTASLSIRLSPNSPMALAEAQSVLHSAIGQNTNPFKSEQDALGTRVIGEEFNAIVVDFFAVFGLLLAAIGIYGNVAYAVSRRSREIGVRMALGAQRQSILWSMASVGARLGVPGLLFGAFAGFETSRALAPIRQHITDVNPWLGAGAVGVMGVVIMIATLLPAYRATRVDPLIVLRGD